MTTSPSTKFEFDDDFERKVAALLLRDATFNIRTDSLIRPEYFENSARAVLVDMALEYWEKYKSVADIIVLRKLIKDAVADKRIRSDMIKEVAEEFKALIKADVSGRDFVVDSVSDFARHQAIIAALEKSLSHLDKRNFNEIEKLMGQALQVGANDGMEGHDLFEEIEARAERRKEILAGTVRKAVTSGSKAFDDATADGGFTRGELAVLLGPAKRGKSFGLANFALGAVLAGYNVLFVTLENSVEITTNRMEAFLSRVETKKLNLHIDEVKKKVRDRLEGKGVMKIHNYAPGTFSPRDLKRLIESYKAKGILFDEIVVDYWDIMKPPVSYRDDAIRESASIGIELRALAIEENVAMVTAIQSNRDGFKATVAGAEHAAEDFNKVRLADILFSINATDEERSEGKARIYFAAVRNTEGGYTLEIKQDLSRAIFIDDVIGRVSI
jgi:replicative DNA helicase